MISICIPIYNRDMSDTVRELASQIRSLDVPCELICIDDHSDNNFAEKNKHLGEAGKYVVLDENVGRARIRNLFLKYASYDYLLFLDCDSLVTENFLSCYVRLLMHERTAKVVCGGRVYDAKSDDREHHLRYVYGVKCESHTAEQRRKYPYRSFMTNNFIVHRDVLKEVPFDERISRYGHEDTLFGYRLMQHKVPIVHIDNPVINGDVETNEEFMRKTADGVKSLADIYRWMGNDKEFVKQVSLLRFYDCTQRWKLNRCIYCLFKLVKPWIAEGLKRGERVNMKLFAFYKLGLLIENIGVR